MGLNELVFGSLTVLGIVVFLFVGRFRANRSQRERADRLRWNAVDKEQSSEKKSWISMGWSAALTVIGQFRGVESGLGIEQPGLDCVLDHSTPLLVHLRQCQHRAFESKIHRFFKTGHGSLIILVGAVAIQIHAAQSV